MIRFSETVRYDPRHCDDSPRFACVVTGDIAHLARRTIMFSKWHHLLTRKGPEGVTNWL
jgi:hypothetical protein